MYKSSPCLHPTPTSPSELSSRLHLWAKNTNRLFNTRRSTWNSGTRPFWVQQAHLNSRLWPPHLGEIHTTVPLPTPSKTPAETSYDLKSTCHLSSVLRERACNMWGLRSPSNRYTSCVVVRLANTRQTHRDLRWNRTGNRKLTEKYSFKLKNWVNKLKPAADYGTGAFSTSSAVSVLRSRVRVLNLTLHGVNVAQKRTIFSARDSNKRKGQLHQSPFTYVCTLGVGYFIP